MGDGFCQREGCTVQVQESDQDGDEQDAAPDPCHNSDVFLLHSFTVFVTVLTLPCTLPCLHAY